MALAITAYGTKVLREVCKDITQEYEGLENLIENMWDTMYETNGVGLAAPQVNRPVRLFIVDTVQVYEDMKEEDRQDLFEDEEPVKDVFINAQIIGESEDVWTDQEGCLSVPDLSGDVERPWAIEIEYFDKDFNKHTKTFSGYNARVIQHEYDHTEGILYVDHIKGLSKRLMKGKLNKIAEGKIAPRYRMIFSK